MLRRAGSRSKAKAMLAHALFVSGHAIFAAACTSPSQYYSSATSRCGTLSRPYAPEDNSTTICLNSAVCDLVTQLCVSPGQGGWPAGEPCSSPCASAGSHCPTATRPCATPIESTVSRALTTTATAAARSQGWR